jgi:hypothetical protein
MKARDDSIDKNSIFLPVCTIPFVRSRPEGVEVNVFPVCQHVCKENQDAPSPSCLDQCIFFFTVTVLELMERESGCNPPSPRPPSSLLFWIMYFVGAPGLQGSRYIYVTQLTPCRPVVVVEEIRERRHFYFGSMPI